MTDFEFVVPVVIVGGGACGAVAALSAVDEGVTPLVIEQDAAPSGTTAMSQGLFCAAGTKAQAALGIEDGPDVFFADIMAKTRGQTDPVIARAIAEESGPCLDWLVERWALPWTLDVGFRASYGNSRQRVHGWHGHSGADMIQLLHGRLQTAGVDVLTEARLVDIVADEGRVRGIIVERPDGAREAVGCGALVLACGGFAANREMVAANMPEAAEARYNGHEGSRGDAVRLGSKIGAALGDMGSYQGYGMLTDPQGITLPPAVLIEGGVLINRDGRRFANETDDIAGLVHPVLAQPGSTAWAVYDAGIEATCSYTPEMRQLVELNAARSADTVAGLAERIGVDASALDAALAGGRETDELGRRWDGVRPPAPPFRALKVTGAIYHTQGGLQIDGNARVLRTDGTPFENLFAGGGAARGVSGPSYWGYLPAMGLCAAVTLGRVAGRSAARVAQPALA